MSLFQSSDPTGVRVNTRSGSKEAPFTGPAWWVAALLLFGALLLQTELLHYVSWRGAEPSLVLVLVTWYALHANWPRAAIFGLVAGVCEDALGVTGGAWTIATPIAAVAATMLGRWVFSDSIPVAGAIVFLCTLLRSMIFWIVMALQGYPPGYAGLHLHQALWGSLLNAALLAALMLLARRYRQPDL